MPNQDLIDYIKKLLSQGYSRDEIREALFSSGWRENQIREAFASTEERDARTAKFPRSFIKIKKNFFAQNKKIVFSIVVLLVLSILWAIAVFVMKPVVQNPPQVSVSEQPQQETITEEEALEWKIYQNTEFGFEFQYPENWRTISSKDEYIEIGNSLFGIYLDDQGNLENQPQILFLVKTTKGHLFLSPGESSRKWETYTLGGQDAYVSAISTGIDFLLPLKNEEQWLFISTDQYPELNKITEEILSTVRIIEPIRSIPETSEGKNKPITL